MPKLKNSNATFCVIFKQVQQIRHCRMSFHGLKVLLWSSKHIIPNNSCLTTNWYSVRLFRSLGPKLPCMIAVALWYTRSCIACVVHQRDLSAEFITRRRPQKAIINRVFLGFFADDNRTLIPPIFFANNNRTLLPPILIIFFLILRLYFVIGFV